LLENFVAACSALSIGWHGCCAGSELAAADEAGEGSQLRTGGYELAVGGGEAGGAGRVLGSRQLARYYRQSYRPADARRSVAVASLVDQCAPTKETLRDW